MPISKDELKEGDFVKIKSYNCYKYGKVIHIKYDKQEVNVKTYCCKSRSCSKGNKSLCYETDLCIDSIKRKCNKAEIEQIMVDLL